MEGLQKLFYLQSSISMANGFLQEFAETGGETTKKIAELGMGVSTVMSTMIATKEFADQLTDMAGIAPKDQVGIGGMLGKITGGAGCWWGGSRKRRWNRQGDQLCNEIR